MTCHTPPGWSKWRDSAVLYRLQTAKCKQSWIASIIGLAVICCGCSVGFASELSLFTGGNHAGMKGPFAVLGQGQSSLSWFSWFCFFCFFCSFFFLFLPPFITLPALQHSQCLPDYRTPTRRHTAQAPLQRLHYSPPEPGFVLRIVLDEVSFASQVIDRQSPAASAPDWGSVRH